MGLIEEATKCSFIMPTNQQGFYCSDFMGFFSAAAGEAIKR